MTFCVAEGFPCEKWALWPSLKKLLNSAMFCCCIRRGLCTTASISQPKPMFPASTAPRVSASRQGATAARPHSLNVGDFFATVAGGSSQRGGSAFQPIGSGEAPLPAPPFLGHVGRPASQQRQVKQLPTANIGLSRTGGKEDEITNGPQLHTATPETWVRDVPGSRSGPRRGGGTSTGGGSGTSNGRPPLGSLFASLRPKAQQQGAEGGAIPPIAKASAAAQRPQGATKPLTAVGDAPASAFAPNPSAASPGTTAVPLFPNVPTTPLRRPGTMNGTRTSSTPTSVQQDFHRGLVSALQEVLRQQRQGHFPSNPSAATESERPTTTADARAAPPHPAARGGLRSRPSSESGGGAAGGQPVPPPPFGDDDDDTTTGALHSAGGGRATASGIAAAIRQRKQHWASRHWAHLRRDAPPDGGIPSGGMTGMDRSASGYHHRPPVGGEEDGDEDDPFPMPAPPAKGRHTRTASNPTSRAEVQEAFVSSQSLGVSAQEGRAHREDSAAELDESTLKIRGNEAYDAADYAEAHRCYGQAIAAAEQRIADPQHRRRSSLSKPDGEAGPLTPIALLYTNRAAAHLALLNFDACVRDCEQAIRHDAACVRAHARMAKALALSGRVPEADGSYASAIQAIEADAPAPMAELRQRLLDERRALPSLRLALDSAARGDLASAMRHFSANLGGFAAEHTVRFQRLRCLSLQDPGKARGELVQLVGQLEPQVVAYHSTSNAVIMASLVGLYCDALVQLARTSFQCGQHYADISISLVLQCRALRPLHRGAVEVHEMITTFVDRFAEGTQAAKADDLGAAIVAFEAAIQALGDHLEGAAAAQASQTTHSRAKVAVLAARSEAASRLGGDASLIIADCTAILVIDGLHVKALVRRSRAHAESGHWNHALSDMEKAAAIEDDLLADLIDMRRSAQEARREQQQQQGADGKGGHTRRGSFAGDRPSAPPSSTEHPSLYEVLGLPHRNGCDPALIRSQYRKLTLAFHPDKVVNESSAVRQSCEHRFKEVAHAYSVLTDPVQRAAYDAQVFASVGLFDSL